MARVLIRESPTAFIYRDEDITTGTRILLKVLKADYPSGAETAPFDNEWEITHDLALSGIRRALRREKVDGHYALVFPFFEGDPLRAYNFQGPEDLSAFLKLACSIALTLGALHRAHIIHKDLNSDNILYNPETGETQIIDFGISSRLDIKSAYLGNPEHLEGTLAYISPEQTGRMNRVVDYRSDLYSLGVTFYELLTGRLPFDTMDPMALVHCHIAKLPPAPYSVNPDVPKPVGNIIMKLLAKNAEDRYQSAFGLLHDLNTCLSYMQRGAEIPDFHLRANDFSGKLQLSQKLYGREEPLRQLMASFDSCTGGALSVVLVPGSPGAGKSALVHELHKQLPERRVYFAEGKFDQLQRGIPYYAIIQALEELTRLLLAEPEEVLAYWRARMQDIVGGLGKVLIKVLPSLELIIGPQPDVPELPVAENQNRFNYIFATCFRMLCDKRHPFVLFIDDLQWADLASLELLQLLITDKEAAYFLFIGAYRDNEVDAAHPLQQLLATCRQHDAVSIGVRPLDTGDINSMLLDALQGDPAEIAQLAGLVETKTKGNAFFVSQFLRSLYERSLLQFDFTSHRWVWDVSRIIETGVTDNVIELMTGALRSLPQQVQEVLQLAACIGSRFDLDTLFIIAERSREQLFEALNHAMAEGLIMPADYQVRAQGDIQGFQHGARYHFVHDRVQQAVYALIEPERCRKVHLKIGQQLLRAIPPGSREQRIFDIVYQLNLGLELLEDEPARQQLATLNLEAGMKAKTSAAFDASLSYFRHGISLLPDDAWQRHYSLTLKLYTEGAETAYLCGQHELRAIWLNEVFAHARNVLDSVKAYNIKIDAETSLNLLPAACATGVEVLRKLGIHFPAKPGTHHVAVGLLRTKLLLLGRDTSSLAELPTLTDPYIMEAMPILDRLTPPAFMSGSQLFPLIVFKMVDLSVRYGNSKPSAIGYASYAIALAGVLGDYESGYRFGQVSWQTLQRHFSEEFKVKVLFVLNTFIRHWKEHLRSCIAPLQEAYQTGLKVGNLVGGIWAAYYYLTWKFYTATPLAQLEEETSVYLDAFARYKQDAAFQRTSMLRQVLLNLIHEVASPATITGAVYKEEQIEAIRAAGNDKTSVLSFHLYKMMLAYLFEQHDTALANANAGLPLLDSVTGLPELTMFRFYEGLVRIRAGEYEKARSILRKLRKWSEVSPENYLHRYRLVLAEYLRAKHRYANAGAEFDAAIAGAKRAGYMQEHALAAELAAAHHLGLGDEQAGISCLKQAVAAYRQWGAAGKVTALFAKYPMLHIDAGGQSFSSGSNASGTGPTQQTLDLTSVLKASTAISGAIRLEKLVEQLLKICIEHSGAQRAVLLLPAHDGWESVAVGEVTDIGISIRQGMQDAVAVPRSIIHYTTRTRGMLITDDAGRDERFMQDPYVREAGTRSVLCLQVINQGIITAVLYLENNLATGAFTPQRTEVLQLLLGQMAVSLENARLYENLEQKVAERTAELEEEKEKSDKLLRNILPVETAAELKGRGFAKPRFFQEVTVMFTDFVNFSSTVRNMSAEDLVAEIHFYYSAFDEIISRRGLEKIKTIGDSYMCAAGLPAPSPEGARQMVLAAMDILHFLESIRARKILEGKPVFRCRIGMHSGPVVAGIVGTRKFAYDIWGETVNIASRMETASEADRINISGAVYHLVKDFYRCSYRGKIEGKNVGLIDMYFVEEAVGKIEDQAAWVADSASE